ncbi:MAG: glycosyltransferase family 2 protein [Acidimicrobiales bacterium]
MTTVSGSARPELSVVIASVNGLPYPLACLDALTSQEGMDPEIILADCTGAGTVAAVRERFPDVRVLAFDEQKSVPWLRAAGIREATGRLVAITEDHCVPTPDWCRRLVAAQERTGWAAVGGGVRNGSRERLIDWVVFFCEYSQHMDPVDDGPSSVLPGMNVAYDMDALADMKSMFAEGLWESFLHERLAAAGHVLGLSADVVVDHQKYFTPRMFASERFHYSRSFAGMRVAGRGLGTRVAWAAGSLALPPVLVARITRRVLDKRQYAGWYLRSLPLVVAFSFIWAAGEWWGYLTGPGDSLVKVR